MGKRFMSPADRAQAKIDELSGVPAEAAPGQPEGTEPPIEASPEPSVVAPEVVPPPAPVEISEGTFKARWETLQGMYRTLNEEKTYLVGRVNALETQIASSSSMAAPEPGAPAAKGVNELLDLISDGLGADLAGQIQQLIQQSTSSQMAPVAQRLETVATDNLKTRQDTFESSLTARVPGWRNMHGSPAFEQWLHSKREQFSGLSYFDCFTRANNDWDLEGLVGIFNSYAPPAPPVVPPPPVVDPRLGLVAPGRGGGSGVVELAPTERFFKQSEVNAFYKDVTLGKYRGRPAEEAQMDALINQANMAGRILPG